MPDRPDSEGRVSETSRDVGGESRERVEAERRAASLRSRALTERIHEEIRLSGGAVTFARFMEMALYEPGLGYYTNPSVAIGRTGDFYTASNVHPVFGETIATAIAKRWDSLGRPDPFWIVEAGAGEGYLASDILSFVRRRVPDFWPSVRYAIVEKSSSLRARQRERLGWLAEADETAAEAKAGLEFRLGFRSGVGRVAWCDSLAAIRPGGIVGCVLANELLDAFPVHRVMASVHGLQEIYVASAESVDGGEDDREFVEVAGPPSTPELERYFAGQEVELKPGFEAEVNLGALAWLDEVAVGLARGYAIVIDYGDEKGGLYDVGHPRGTFLCYRAHAVSEDPYQDVGLQDITAHVNFSALIDRARELGLSVDTFTTQGRFLITNGILERVPPARLEGGKLVHDPNAERLSRAILTLVTPEGMGRGFKVLILGKDA